MSFDYDKILKKENDHGSWWTSYADLFMMLSIVFLLMYVASSLRNGSASLQQQVEYKKLSQKAEDLEQQIRVYNTLKDEALRTQTSAQEQETYNKMLDKLSLLKEEAGKEKNTLAKQAKENEDKEFALNQYQQLIRNVINANILAKAQISRRDEIITKKEQTLEEKKKLISQMRKTMTQNETQIKSINQKLDRQILALIAAQKQSKSSKKLLESRIAKLKNEGQSMISELSEKNESISQELGQTRVALESTKKETGVLAAKLSGTEAEKTRALANIKDLREDLEKTRAVAFAKKRLAELVSANFAKAGIKGAVDAKTGEVTLDFGDEYFDTGSTQLKPEMKITLDKFIPAYAKSLFSDLATANKIANVEIVGFASSTFRGMYVNPKSTRPEDKEAIEYNLKLSFGRANSIFSHVLRAENFAQGEKEKLLPLIKVVGRGYLPDGINSTDESRGLTEKKFCAKFNCKKAQKVIVKFNLKD